MLWCVPLKCKCPKLNSYGCNSQEIMHLLQQVCVEIAKSKVSQTIELNVEPQVAGLPTPAPNSGSLLSKMNMIKRHTLS